MSETHVQVISISAYNGCLNRYETVVVDKDKPIVTQCFKPGPNDDEDDLEDYQNWIDQFKETSTGYVLRDEESIHNIVWSGTDIPER